MKHKALWLAAAAFTFVPCLALAQVEGELQPVTATGLDVETNFRGEVITEPTWVLERLQEMSVDSSDAGTATDFVAQIQKLALKGVGNVGIMLSCQTILGDDKSPARLNVAFDFDKSADQHRTRMRIRHISGHLKIADKSKAERWIWNPETMRVVPHSRNVPRRVFNAAVRGDRIRLKALGKWQIDIDLPEINQDFRDFVKTCPVLRPKKK